MWCPPPHSFSPSLSFSLSLSLHTHRLLFVGEDDIAMKSLHHEQCLTESPRPLPEYLVRLHGNDRAESKDERVDILHVKVVGCHGIGYRVIGQPLARLKENYGKSEGERDMEGGGGGKKRRERGEEGREREREERRGEGGREKESYLWIFTGHSTHLFRVQFHRIIT